MRKCLLIWLAALVVSLGARGAQDPLRVLILSGRNNHDWRLTTPKLKSILTASGRFVVEVTEHPEACKAETFSRYDALLSNWNTFGDPAATNWPDATRAALLDFVRGGKGLVVVHAGGSSFYDWPEYQQLVGASWEMGQTSHGSPHEFTVSPSGEHSITSGMKPFRTTDELWVRPGVGSLSRPLATGDDQPVAFTLEFGRGRGFTLLLGHSAAFMDTPGFQTLLLRGAEWAATGKVTIPADAVGLDSDAILMALANYRFGDNRKPIQDLERLVAAVSKDAIGPGLARKLTAMLSTDATVEAKQVICQQLSLIGSAVDVPALAEFAADKNLGYYARQALERIPGPEAESALLAALENSTGEVRVGIINALAARRGAEAVQVLAKLLAGSDVTAAGAALDALGQIGGEPAAGALLSAEGALPPLLKPRLSLALLRCAQGEIAPLERRHALTILERLTATEMPPAIRIAAFGARAKLLGDQGREAALAALSSGDEVLEEAAVRALRSTPKSDSLATAVAERLGKLPEPFQVQVIVWLGECGFRATQPALIKAALGSASAVRDAALVALGLVSDASVIPILAEMAANGSDDDRRIVADSLARLRGSDVDSVMIQTLKKVGTAEQRQLIRTLELRETKMAVPALIELAGGNDSLTRQAALVGVGKLGDVGACAALVPFLDRDPEIAASAMAEICRREATAEPLLVALEPSSSSGKASLLEALASIGGPRALAAVRAEVKAQDSLVRLAAVRSLGNWLDAAPLDDLAALASRAPDPACKALALRGVARLAPLARDHPGDAVEIIARAMKISGGSSEQRALLAALGEIADANALKAARSFLEDPALAHEAKAAVDQIEERLSKTAAAPWDAQIVALFNSPENLCRGAIATNMDNLTPDGQGLGPFAALDGNPETYWDETDNQPLYWLRVQLKQPASVACLRLLGYQHHNYAPKDFEVLGNGKLLKKVEHAVYQRNLLTVDLPPTECQTIELKITGYYGQSPAIRELGLFGKPAAER